MCSFRKEPKGFFFEIPRPLCLKGLHLSFVFPPLREGKKQKVAEADTLLWVLVSGYGPDDSFYKAARDRAMDSFIRLRVGFRGGIGIFFLLAGNLRLSKIGYG